MSESSRAVLESARAAVYKARWVDAFGRTTVLPTDEEIAKAVVEAIYETIKAEVAPRLVSTAEELDEVVKGSLVSFENGLGRVQDHTITALSGGNTTLKYDALPVSVVWEPHE